MLKLADCHDISRLDDFCRTDALGTRIRCLLSAYGVSSPLANFWFGEEDGEITCAVCLFDGCATVIAGDNVCLSELSAFLTALDFTDLCAAHDLFERLGLRADFSKKMFRYTAPLSSSYETAQSDYDDLSEVYDLISRAIPGSFSPDRDAYLCWLSDYTFRRRRGLARLKTISDGEKLLACALTASECDDAAIISGVACDPKARGKHLGQRTVRTIADELAGEGKQVYVIALNDEASSFYLKTGFTYFGTLSYIERKNGCLNSTKK